MFVGPFIQIEIVILLGPEHSGERLPMYAALIFTERARGDLMVELIGLGHAREEYLIELVERIGKILSIEAQTYGVGSTGGHFEDIVGRHLGTGSVWIDGFLFAIHDVLVKSVLHIGGFVGLPHKRVELLSFSVNSRSGEPSQGAPVRIDKQ